MKLYAVKVDIGSYEDYRNWVAGIFDCPIKADEAKRTLQARAKELESDDPYRYDFNTEHFSVEEFELNIYKGIGEKD